MGTGRKKSVERMRRQRKTRKIRAALARSAAAKPPSPMILRTESPRAGMIYPFKYSLTSRRRHDYAVMKLLKEGKGVSKITTDLLNDTFSLIFQEASSKLLEREEEMEGCKENPIDFIESLHASPRIRELWPETSLSLFASLFLVLRAARQNWHDKPRLPYNHGEHCQLAREIDTFEALDRLNWAHLAFLDWILRGGIEIPAGEEDDEVVDIVVDDEDDDMVVDEEEDGAVNMEVDADDEQDQTMEVDSDKAGPSTATAAATASTTAATTSAAAPADAPAADAITDEVRKLAAGLRRLHISVPGEVLAQAFARLSLEERPAEPVEAEEEDAQAGGEDKKEDDQEDEEVDEVI